MTKQPPETPINCTPKPVTVEAITTVGDGYYVQLCYTDSKYGCRRVRAFFIERHQAVGPLREMLVRGRSVRIGGPDDRLIATNQTLEGLHAVLPSQCYQYRGEI